MAEWIKATGELDDVVPTKGKTFSLKELQTMVGGYIELVRTPAGLMFVNEEGRLRDLPVNPTASNLAGQLIVGDAVLCQPDEVD